MNTFFSFDYLEIDRRDLKQSMNTRADILQDSFASAEQINWTARSHLKIASLLAYSFVVGYSSHTFRDPLECAKLHSPDPSFS